MTPRPKKPKPKPEVPSCTWVGCKEKATVRVGRSPYCDTHLPLVLASKRGTISISAVKGGDSQKTMRTLIEGMAGKT